MNQHPRCWDSIAHHISNPDVAPFLFNMIDWLVDLKPHEDILIGRAYCLIETRLPFGKQCRTSLCIPCCSTQYPSIACEHPNPSCQASFFHAAQSKTAP